MSRYALDIRDAAFDDLAGIRKHIAEARGDIIADRFVARILDHLATFRTFPFRGTKHDDLRPGLRIVGWRHTVTIAFVPNEEQQKVTILAVLYRGQDVTAALTQR